ncbi:hypothetical protein LL946_04455 [Knoellia locipacati]|uniref:hypothetical protein n=1 Tax=Knoellia locipacati TaxID=882824 RepID=UPI0038505907
MGIDVVFHSAPDDETAAAAQQAPGGPLGWSRPAQTPRPRWWRRTTPVVEDPAPVCDGFLTRGYDGVVTMGTLEELLTGRPYDDLERDPRWGGPVGHQSPDDNRGGCTLTTTLRDALAEADDAQLSYVVEPWAHTEELAPTDGGAVHELDLAAHLEFLHALRDLARRAKASDHGLYWYFEL